MTFKRIILLLLAVAAAITTACGSRPPKQLTDIKGISARYTAKAYISGGAPDAVALINRENPARCVVAFESPPGLEGMEYVFDEDGVTLKYLGLSYGLHPSSVPHGAAAKLITQAINQALTGQAQSITREEDTLEVQGETAAGRYILSADAQSGVISKLLVPAEELEIEFLNFTYLDW